MISYLKKYPPSLLILAPFYKFQDDQDIHANTKDISLAFKLLRRDFMDYAE